VLAAVLASDVDVSAALSWQLGEPVTMPLSCEEVS